MDKRTDIDKIKDIKTRQTALEQERLYWEGLWTDILNYYPKRVNIDPRTATKGQTTGSYVYNTAHLNALRIMADGFYGYLVAPSLRWFALRLPNTLSIPRTSMMRQYNGQQVNDIPEVQAWLEDTEEVLYSAFLRSNFYDAMPEFFWDGGSIGTAVLFSEEDVGKGRIAFSSRHIGECYIDEDKHGTVDTIYRKVKIKLRNLMQRFDKDTVLKACKAREMTATNMNTEYEVIHAIQPRSDREYGRMDAKGMPVESTYILGETILNESGFRVNPCCVWRMDKNTFEVYGRGPGTESIIAVKYLNKMDNHLGAAMEEAVFPAIAAPSELRGLINLKPRGFTYYEDEKRPIAPINAIGQIPWSLEWQQDAIRQIDQHFMVDFFLMLERSDKQMTAREVMERQGEKAAVMGARVGRLQSDVLNPIIDRVFDIEQEAGRIPPLPQILMDLGGQKIEVDYLGPLATAQMRLFKNQGITASLQIIAPIMEVKPDIADNINWDEMTREILETNGMPSKCINDEDTRNAIREQRNQQAQAMQAAEEGKVIADALPKAGKAVESGSPLAMLMNGEAA